MAATKGPIRPAAWLALLLLGLSALDATFYRQARQVRQRWQEARPQVAMVTAALGLTDLCLATEARYTRHPAVSDPLAPFMDYPGSLEHFPTGSFWAYPTPSVRGEK